METDKTVALYTLGCKLNFSETATIGRLFQEAGYRRADFKSPADVYLINTCSVTENADREFRSIVKAARRINPSALVVVLGCYAQLRPEQIARMEGVGLVIGTRDKFRVVELVEKKQKDRKAEIHSCDVLLAEEFHEAYSLGDRTRSFLKIQDGCDYKCSYCTIHAARGRSRSDSSENVIGNIRKIVGEGIREIVLTGVNIGDWRRPGESFSDLIRQIDRVEGLERVRISSIEPNLLTEEIIGFCAESKTFVPHFHIPLQSGSDEILHRMRRRYSSDLYARRVEQIKKHMPQASIGVDVIVGFPGETDELFAQTHDFLQGLDISYLHVFTYSERPGTPAAEMPGAVPHPVRRERNRILHELSEEKKNRFYSGQIGHIRPVLLESDNKEGFMHGFSDNYVKVKMPFEEALSGRIIPIRFVSMDEKGDMLGEIAED